MWADTERLHKRTPREIVLQMRGNRLEIFFSLWFAEDEVEFLLQENASYSVDQEPRHHYPHIAKKYVQENFLGFLLRPHLASGSNELESCKYEGHDGEDRGEKDEICDEVLREN